MVDNMRGAWRTAEPKGVLAGVPFEWKSGLGVLHVRRIISVLGLVSLLALSAAALPGLTMAASPTTTPTVETNSGQLPAWVIKANPYVHVSNGIATMSTAASTSLDAATYSQASQAVSRFNALPPNMRTNPQPVKVIGVTMRPGVVQPMAINMSACISGSYISFEWWGAHFKMSECLTQYVTKTATALGAIIAVIGVIPGVAPVVIPIGLIIAATGPVIDWVDTTFCNQHGVAINLPVIGPDNIGC